MPFRSRSSHQTKTAVLVGFLSFILYALLGVSFFACLSINNVFLLHVNRTLATTLLTYTAMSIAMHAVYGGYEVGRKKNKPVISAMISSVAITDIITYFQLEIMNVNPDYNEHLILFGPDLLCLLLCFIIQVIAIILFVRIGNQLYFYFTPPRSCLLILGSPSQEEALRSKIERYKLQWRVDDVVLYNVPDLSRRIEKADVIFIGHLPSGAKIELMKICYDDRKDVMCKAELEDIMLCNAKPTIVDDAAFLSMDYNKITLFQRFAKRCGDIIISLFALIFFSPFILLISLLIKLEDGGPIIFKQSRLTIAGRPFTIRKFRTMAPHSELDEVQVSVAVDDPRITKVGSFLRRFRLDEIPQFYNILIGDMSIVGPRPEMMANVARYKMNLPSFVYREKMKAGLTGYAQIEGRYNTSAEDKLMLDMMYIESFSIWMDVKLLLRTFTVLMKKDSTQGFQKSPGSNILEKNEEILKNEHNTSDHGSRSRFPVRRKQTD
ncbi:MAG: exopolysaccharide biosynthesis polyprenyl glycosylphosphotransferase [Clostridia bacterium]|nr:exopolysaccharide biosynthesis polyprenyl glycosylphosphotransferase [Clostridia bacterium]